MTQEQLIKLAREASSYANEHANDVYDWSETRDMRFAALVAATEREALVRMCETWVDWADDGSDYHKGFSDACSYIANAIKSRGNS